MAITTNYKDIQGEFNPNYWKSIGEFEEYYIRRIQETMADTNYYTDRNGIERKINFIDNHPILKEYEVWCEGYAATGERGSAYLVGKCFARNFAQACDIVMCKSHLKWIDEVNNPLYKEYNPPQKWDYDPKRLTYWGCRLFWSKELAMKSFG